MMRRIMLLVVLAAAGAFGGVGVSSKIKQLGSTVVRVPAQTRLEASPLANPQNQKRVLKTSLKEARKSLVKLGSQETRDKAITFATEVLLKGKDKGKELLTRLAAVLAQVAAQTKLVLLAALASFAAYIASKKTLPKASKPTKALPVSSTTASASDATSSPAFKPPRITNSLLPLPEAKMAVSRRIAEIAKREDEVKSMAATSTVVTEAKPASSVAAASVAVPTSTSAAISTKAAAPSEPAPIPAAAAATTAAAEAEVDKEEPGTMAKIKSLGTSGIIAYIITELGFWATSLPSALLALHEEEGRWLSLTDEADRVKVIAFAATIVTGARLLVPLRLSMALALAPVVDKIRGGDAFASKDEPKE